MLPYQHAASNKISWRLTKCDMMIHHLPVKKTTQGKIGLQTPDALYVVYHVDVGRSMSDKQAFRNQMQGTHEAPFPGQPDNSVVAERIMGTGQHVIQEHLQIG